MLRAVLHMAMQYSIKTMELLTVSDSVLTALRVPESELYEPISDTCLLADLKKWLSLYLDSRIDFIDFLSSLIMTHHSWRAIMDVMVMERRLRSMLRSVTSARLSTSISINENRGRVVLDQGEVYNCTRQLEFCVEKLRSLKDNVDQDSISELRNVLMSCCKSLERLSVVDHPVSEIAGQFENVISEPLVPEPPPSAHLLSMNLDVYEADVGDDAQPLGAPPPPSSTGTTSPPSAPSIGTMEGYERAAAERREKFMKRRQERIKQMKV